MSVVCYWLSEYTAGSNEASATNQLQPRSALDAEMKPNS